MRRTQSIVFYLQLNIYEEKDIKHIQTEGKTQNFKSTPWKTLKNTGNENCPDMTRPYESFKGR